MAKSNFVKKHSAVGTVIAAVCILVYLSALVYIIVNVNISMEKQREKADDEFNEIRRIVEEFSPNSEFLDDDHKEKIQNKVNSSLTIEGIIVTGGLKTGYFEKEPGGVITFNQGGSPRLTDRFSLIKFMPYSVSIEGQRNVIIDGRFSKFNYSELTYSLTRALLMIAAALVLSFFTLLIDSQSKDKQKSKVKARKLPNDKPKENAATINYSKRGNVISEEFTESRLSEELQRSVQSNADLAFIVMEFKLPVDDDNYSRFALDAARFFSSRDFVCEMGLKGISVICPALNIDTAFLNADEFHNRIMGKYPGLIKQKTDLCIGISARSDRSVVPERLMMEAEEALERAMMDPVSHIVAFKSDPEKYKQFMESREEE